jgi:hypothetical protein
MPIKICRECERLFSSNAKARKFCSDKCRENSFWPPERRRDYNKVLRWEERAADCAKGKNGFTLADLERLEKITSKNHALDKIAARWKKWPKMKEKVQCIGAAFDRLHAGR